MSKIAVYSRPFGKLICHLVTTDCPVRATEVVAQRYNELQGLTGSSSREVNMRLSERRWSLGPFLALVPKVPA